MLYHEIPNIQEGMCRCVDCQHLAFEEVVVSVFIFIHASNIFKETSVRHFSRTWGTSANVVGWVPWEIDSEMEITGEEHSGDVFLGWTPVKVSEIWEEQS